MHLPKKIINPRLIKAAVYGANDGIITTFAVMAGVVGAQLNSGIVLILGLANLFADGISMGLGDFIGERSERRLRANHKQEKVEGKAWETGLVTFVSFIVAGTAPLLPFIANNFWHIGDNQFIVSLITTGLALFLVGSARTYFTGGNWLRNGFEMFAIGMLAAGVAYMLGGVARNFVDASLL